MTTTTFSWKKLRDELAMSEYLSPEDDLRSQRGVVAAATAIMERMSNSERMREVTWQPVRLATAATLVIPLPEVKPKPKPKGKNGNARVTNPTPVPVLPGPAGAYATIEF